MDKQQTASHILFSACVCVSPRWRQSRSTRAPAAAGAPALAVRGWFRMSSKWNVSWRQTCYSRCGRNAHTRSVAFNFIQRLNQKTQEARSERHAPHSTARLASSQSRLLFFYWLTKPSLVNSQVRVRLDNVGAKSGGNRKQICVLSPSVNPLSYQVSAALTEKACPPPWCLTSP